MAHQRLRLLGYALLISAIVGWCRSTEMLDHQYLYFPSAWEADDWKALSGLPLEDVWLTTSDGVRLFGWYVEAPNRQGVLLWCHGNAGNISHRIHNAHELYRRGLSFLLFDYRGYGQSAGRPSEDGLYQDGLAAYDYLVKERRIDPTQLIIFGRSLGAAVAGEIARAKPAAGLILETPFPSVEAVARDLFGGMPAHMLLAARYDLVARLKTIRKPVLVVHGDQDTIIPFPHGEAVYQAAHEPKRFYRIPGADHNNTYEVGGEDYFQALLAFIREATTQASSSP